MRARFETLVHPKILGGHGTQTIEWKNPFDLPSALQFALFIAFIILLSSLAARHFGSNGLLSLAALSGLADVDAITLALARPQDPPIDQAVATNGILLAAMVNTLIKSAIAGWTGGTAIGWRTLLANAGAIAAAGAVLLIMNV